MTNKIISFREINRLAIPSVFAGIIEPLISLTDVAMVGNLPANSKEALAAVGIVGSMLSAMLWVLASTKTSTSSIIAKYVGMQKINQIKQLLPQAIIINILFSIFLVIIAQIFSHMIFSSFFLVKGLTLEYCIEYFKIRSFAFPITLATFTIFGAFRGIQNTSWAMTVSLFGGIFNALLDYIFVYPLNLGVVGVAWASVIAQSLMFVMALWFLFKKSNFHLKPGKWFHPEMKGWIYISLNLFVRTIVLNLTIIYANRLASDYGNSFMAAHGILINVWLFSSFLIDGYANAGNAISGKLLGQNNQNLIWKLGLKLIGYAMIVTSILMACYTLFYEYIGLIFTKEQEVLKIFMEVFWAVIIIQPLNALAFTLDGVYKGMGRAKILRNILIIGTFVGFFPSLFVFERWSMGLIGIWCSFLVWMGIRSIGLFIIFRNNFRLSKS